MNCKKAIEEMSLNANYQKQNIIMPNMSFKY